MTHSLYWHFSTRFSDTIIAESEESGYMYRIQVDEAEELFKVSVFKEDALDPWYTAGFETLYEAVKDCENTELLATLHKRYPS